MDREQSLLDKMFKISEKEKVNQETFRFDKEPLSDEEREIKKEYDNMIRTVLTRIPIYNKDTELCFEGAYREFLKSIKQRYAKEIWQIKRPQKKKKISAKEKKHLR